MVGSWVCLELFLIPVYASHAHAHARLHALSGQQSVMQTHHCLTRKVHKRSLFLELMQCAGSKTVQCNCLVYIKKACTSLLCGNLVDKHWLHLDACHQWFCLQPNLVSKSYGDTPYAQTGRCPFLWLFTYVLGASLYLKRNGSCLRYETGISWHAYVASVCESTLVARLHIKLFLDARACNTDCRHVLYADLPGAVMYSVNRNFDAGGRVVNCCRHIVCPIALHGREGSAVRVFEQGISVTPTCRVQVSSHRRGVPNISQAYSSLKEPLLPEPGPGASSCRAPHKTRFLLRAPWHFEIRPALLLVIRHV